MLYFDSDSAWWQIWGMGELLPKNLFMVVTVGEKTLVVSIVYVWSVLHLQGIKHCGFLLVTPTPTPGAYATVFDSLLCAGDFGSEGTFFLLAQAAPSTPASRGVQTGFLVLLNG